MSDNQLPSQSTSGESQGTLPRGLIGRRGGAVNPSTRLPSLRPARDLTLGGVQKRAFKPNLNVAGRKDKAQRESIAKEAASPSTPKGRGQRSERGERGRGRGRGRGRPETIQSHSIFEQGPADRLNKKGFGHYGGGGGDRATPSSMTKTVKREKMTEEEASRMQQLLKDDFLSDLEDEDKKYCPIQLPLVASALKKEPNIEPKTEFIKKEPEEVEMEDEGETKKGLQMDSIGDVDMTEEEEKKPVITEEEKPTPPPMTTSRKSLPHRTECAALFGNRTKSEGELLFFQLPDSLPGQPTAPDDDDPRPKVKREPGTAAASTPAEQASQKNSKEDTKPVKCTLESLPEGYLGKLQVLKSGKTRLILGNVTLDVAMGTPCGFLQDLMSIRLDDDERSGELVRLGQVKHRVVCTPDFEALLKLEASK